MSEIMYDENGFEIEEESGWDSLDEEEYAEEPIEKSDDDIVEDTTGLHDEDEMDSLQVAASKESKNADGQLAAIFDLTRGAFSLSTATVNISDIIIPTPIKDSRNKTYLGLSKSIEEFGVLEPIHVMVSEGYSDYLLENGSGEGYDGPRYILLDGLRRLFGAKKNGLDHVNAVIWDFQDKDKGADMIVVLSLVLNKRQRRNWEENWYLYQLLESQSALTPSTMEYLLQLEPGDAMKLKEIMTRADEFPQPKEDLLSGKKSLQQAYSSLMKEMKEQNQLYVEDVKGMGEVEQAEGVVKSGSDDSDDRKLSDDEVKQILDMSNSFDGELSDDDFDELMGNNIPDDRQKVGERHPLDPALRAAVLQRDGYCCQITGRGKGLPTPIALSILNVHHKVPVHCGGTDTMDNLITVCLDVHTLIHVVERNMGKLGMSKEQFESLSEEEQTFITGVMKIARIAVEANKRMGRSREQIKEDTADSIRFKMPGLVQKENMQALASAKISEGTN